MEECQILFEMMTRWWWLFLFALKSKKKDTNLTASPSFQGSSEDGGIIEVILSFKGSVQTKTKGKQSLITTETFHSTGRF